MSAAFAYLAAIIVVGWGIAHIMPTRSVVAGYGPLSQDNRLVLTMEWVAEGMTLIFLGLLTTVVTARGSSGNDVLIAVYAITAAMLVAMAAWTGATGARTSVVFFKLCPVVKTIAAILLVAAIAL
jgi:hypothetical protein